MTLASESAWSALALGWWRVIARALPRVEIDPVGVAVGGVSGVLVVVMLHTLTSWLYTETRTRQLRDDWPPHWRWRWTLCLGGGVVMTFAAGLVGVGLFRTVGWFIAGAM
ncbi:MAG: hypothetical protein EXS16_16555 [Gemmataceae bacterium]|nr:hypothetical protein [Gemmataceae bacterium]